MPIDTGGRDINMRDLLRRRRRPDRCTTIPEASCRRGSARPGTCWIGRTSVRGGYGLYYNTSNQQNLIVTVTNPPATPRVVLRNPTFRSRHCGRRHFRPADAVRRRVAARAHVERERAAGVLFRTGC
jgi:hypothetical protein